MAATPYQLTDAGLVLTLRVTPNAGIDRIEGVDLRAGGNAVLRLRVKAVPDRGKANAAVVALLKTVAIEGESERLVTAVESLISS